jgi:hypothetical protein
MRSVGFLCGAALAAIFTVVFADSAIAQSKRVYSDDAMGIELQYPANYTVKRVDAGTVVFAAPLSGKDDTFSENVNISVTAAEPNAKIADFIDSAKEAIKRAFPDAVFLDEKKETVNKVPALRLVYVTKQKTVFFKIMQLIVLRDKKAYAFTYTAIEDEYQRHLAQAQSIFGSVRFKAVTK